MDEFDLIRKYFAPLATSPGADGLRDDVAEVAPGLIVTKDAIVEGVHFLASDPLDTVARKLVRVNVSDIIAKGARPGGALLALIWPKDRAVAEIETFAAALGDDLRHWGAYLLGGDTTGTDGPLTLTLTMVGKTSARGPVRRSGARAGDDVWVTGAIGDGWLGLQAALGQLDGLGAEDMAALLDRYRVPHPPPLTLADLVAEFGGGSIDISDGLAADARHLAEASGVRLVIDWASVPTSVAALRWLSSGANHQMARLLTGGDDYQTLFTARRENRDAIAASADAAGVRLTRIGAAKPGAGVDFIDELGNEMYLPKGGWTHFGS